MNQPVSPMATPQTPATTQPSAPISAGTGGQGAGTAGSGASILLSNPPPALAALSAGQTIRAVAVGRTAGGKVLVETRFGQLALQLAGQFARGTVMQLEITQSGNPTRLALIDPVAGRSQQAREQPPRTRTGPADGMTPRVGDIVTVTPAISDRGNPAPPFQARIAALGSGNVDSANALGGRVTSSPPGGPTIIQTAGGQVSLPGVGALAPASRIVLAPLSAPQMPATASAGTMPALTELANAWTALEDAHALLASAGAGATTAIPATGSQLTTAMVFFLNALFQGNFREWLGRDAARLLEAGEKRDLLARLSDDFGRVSRLAGEPVGGEWRIAVLPLLDDGILHQIRLFLRDRAGDDATDPEEAGTRFVVEASLSRFGPLQLDGLVRPGRFDLMVRTHAPLPPAIQADITELFGAANHEFGARGRIGYQIQEPFPVRPLDDIANTAEGVYA